MKVVNLHGRVFPLPATRVGALLDSLASERDALWPQRFWPRMRFDRPLAVGARGGHGPIRYEVAAYVRSRAVVFRFLGPRGFDGFHAFEVAEEGGQATRVRHALEMRTSGLAALSWPLVYRPLHDALVEDAFTTAEVSLGLAPRVVPWSWRVRGLRAFFTRGRAARQDFGAQSVATTGGTPPKAPLTR